MRPGVLWALAISLSFVLLALCWAGPASATDLKITWQPVTTDSNGVAYPVGTTITYKVYGGKNGAAFTLATTTTDVSAIRSKVDSGVLCYVVTATVTNESIQSSPPACVTVADPAPPVVQPSGTPSAPANVQAQISQ